MIAETSPGVGFVEASLIFFLALFIGIVIRLVWSRSGRWKAAARIPLTDEIVTKRNEENTHVD